MPDYTWICHKCNSTNVAGVESCQHCGFHATASDVQIQEARTGVKVEPALGRKAFIKARREEFAALPLWKKPFAFALRLLQAVGGIVAWLAIFELSVSLFLAGLVLAAISEFLYQLLKGKPYVWHSS